jgi:hypothetical protein
LAARSSGQSAPAEFFGEGLAGRDVSIEPGNRRFGLLVQVVEQRKIAAQRLLVAVDLDGDAVNLRGNVVELFRKAAHPRLGRREQTADKICVLQARRVETPRLPEHIRQQFAGVSEFTVLRLGKVPVGEFTTECWARSPKVTSRERSVMSISDWMRATAATSGTMAGRFACSSM